MTRTENFDLAKPELGDSYGDFISDVFSGNMDTLDEAVYRNTSDISTLRGQVSSAQSGASGAMSQAQANARKITALETRVSDISTAVEENMKKYFIPNLCEFSAFNIFGIIGDSLSVGAHRESDGTTVLSRDTNSSWGQYIASRCFNQAKWFGYAGATSSSWITKTGSYTDPSGRVDRVGLSAVLDSDNRCDAYIVAFGYNDASGTVPLGSVSDIAQNPDNNADTYYGNMDKIIRKINTAYPNAHIFVLTNPRLNQSMTADYNNAIRTVVNRLSATEKVHCIDLYELYNQKYVQWDSLMWHYHYTKPIYYRMGELIGTALSNYMRENPLTFRFLNE